MNEETTGYVRQMLSLVEGEAVPDELVQTIDRVNKFADRVDGPKPGAGLLAVIVGMSGAVPRQEEVADAEPIEKGDMVVVEREGKNVPGIVKDVLKNGKIRVDLVGDTADFRDIPSNRVTKKE